MKSEHALGLKFWGFDGAQIYVWQADFKISHTYITDYKNRNQIWSFLSSFFLGVSPCNHISLGFLVGVGKDNGHVKI